MLFQKCNQFVRAKVGQHVPVPFQGGRFGLSGELNHPLESRFVGEDVDSVVPVAVGVKMLPCGNTPRAPQFDIQIHRRSQPIIFAAIQGARQRFSGRKGSAQFFWGQDLGEEAGMRGKKRGHTKTQRREGRGDAKDSLARSENAGRFAEVDSNEKLDAVGVFSHSVLI